MNKINFQNLPNTTTPVNATNLNQLQTNVENAINEAITTGVESATNEWIDGEQVFRKRIGVGALPNASDKDVSTGLSSLLINVIRIQGSARRATDGQSYPIPNVSTNNPISIFLRSNGDIRITTTSDRSDYNAYIDLYYTKNT